MCEFSLPCDQKLDSRSDPMIYGTCFIFYFFSGGRKKDSLERLTNMRMYYFF